MISLPQLLQPCAMHHWRRESFQLLKSQPSFRHHSDIVERTGLTQIVRQPTRGANLLDRVFVSDPQLYSTP